MVDLNAGKTCYTEILHSFLPDVILWTMLLGY